MFRVRGKRSGSEKRDMQQQQKDKPTRSKRSEQDEEQRQGEAKAREEIVLLQTARFPFLLGDVFDLLVLA